jgi:AraC family transcriptional regulator of adaptative response / DNA-3-methyladenine glycosylase II
MHHPIGTALRQQYARARLSRDRRFDGRFFVAVKTTGIFCRPICPAKLPKEENVDYYHLAESAMAQGFRPCLRCRPDSAPNSWAWLGKETSVQRALSLLTSQPQQSMAQIAQRMGISERYLHKLVQQSLGISPCRFRMHGRLLFAKTLLQQTTLNIEDVALASGFNSSRRLQSNMQKLMKTSPSQLRKSKTTHSDTSHPIHLELAFRPPYDWPGVRRFLALRAIDKVETVTEDTYQRQFSWPDCEGQFSARYMDSKHAFAISLKLTNLSALKSVLINISKMLDLNADPIHIQDALQRAGIPLDQQVLGLRQVATWSLFEAACRAIIGQQISVKAAINQLTAMVQALGHTNPFGLCFPKPEVVATNDLTMLKMPRARKQAIRELATFILGQPQEGANLADILAIKGIGPWTHAYVAMRGEGDPDILLHQDLIIKQQLAKHAIATDKAAPWRSYLSFQLWRMSDAEKG